MAHPVSTSGGLENLEDSISCSIQSELHEDKERIGRAVLATFIVALGPLGFGYCVGYSSSALEDLASESAAVRLDDIQGSWFSSLFPLGAIFGGPIGGWAIDRLGRKGTIMFCGIPFELGWLILAYAQNRSMLYAGRFITGLACGIISLTVPVYVAETVAARMRGALGCVFQLAVTVGILLAYVMGVLCRWRWVAFIGAIPSALLLILMFSMPETPRWYLGKSRRSEALSVLLWLRGPDADIEEECATIEETLENHERLQLRDVLSPVIAKPLIISIGLMIFQQFCGINSVLFNAASIFGTAGFSNGKLASIAVGLVQFVGTGLACLLMDKAGRRILLLTTALGMCVALVVLGVYFEIYIPPTTTPPPTTDESLASDTVSLLGSINHSVPAKSISWLSILCIVVFNLMFALAWGPVPWLVMSEIFPLRARGLASSFATLTNWTMAFIVTMTFKSMVATLTNQGVYWFYAGCCFVGFIFVYFVMPETKGKTLEEIEAMFVKFKGYQEIE